MGEADGMELIYSLVGILMKPSGLNLKKAIAIPLERGVTSRRLPMLPLTAAAHMPIRSGA